MMSLFSLSRVALQKIFVGGVVFSVSFPAFFAFFVSLFFCQKLCCGLSLSPFSVFLSFSVVVVFRLILLFFLGFFFIHQSRFITKKRVHRESDLFFVRRVSHIKNVSEYTRAHKYTRRDNQIWRSFVSKQKDPFFFRARERERNAVLFRAFVSLLSFFSSLGI